MTIVVNVRCTGSDRVVCRMRQHASVLDLKYVLQALVGRPRRDQTLIVTGGHNGLGDNEWLLDLVGDWFVLGDIMDPMTSRCQLEVNLVLVLRARPCANCGEVAMKKCSRCHVKYCSKECQWQHWPAHKTACQTCE